MDFFEFVFSFYFFVSGQITKGRISTDTMDRLSNDCIHDDDSCKLYSSSGYRLQFLGGYDGDELNEMCYSYKLHEYKHKQGLGDSDDYDFITVSLAICDAESIERGYGVLSDYLTQVTLDNPSDNNNTNNERYYVDDTHFYYVTKNGNNNNTIIRLCFQDKMDNELRSDIISPTEYCISHSKYNNGEKLCSKRGIYVPDICGLQNANFNFAPQTSINYIPIAGKSYKLSKANGFYFIFYVFF